MRKLRYILIAILAVSICACSKTYRVAAGAPTADIAQETAASAIEPEAAADEEGAVQEPAWTYFERLSYLFGADSTCVGMRDDMNFPDWYSGCFVNDRDRLTINVVGDTATIRKMLANKLDGNEFDIGMGLYSKREQIRTSVLLNEAIANRYKGFHGNLISGSNEDGTIDICIQGDNDSVIAKFKKEVFDSPLLRFTIADEVRIIPQTKGGAENTDDER